MNESEKSAWVADARALLDASTQSLDAATLSRLNRARQAALGQRQRKSRTWWLPAAGFAASCALVLAVVVWYPQQRAAVAPAATHVAAAADAEVAAADDGIEFYQDLEFYAWLDAQEQDSDG